MKEFGLYTLKNSYITRFSPIEPNLENLKGEYRPFVCIKLTTDRQNWLVPIASINPASSNYWGKLSKYKNFVFLDKEQARKDGNQFARAINIVRDLTGLHDDSKFMSVIQYYNAIPVKHKYCSKYRDKAHRHICVEDKKLKEVIKKTLLVNIKAKLRGSEIGFIKAKISEGLSNFVHYPKKSIQIRDELYKEHFALQKAEKAKRERAEQRSAEITRKKVLKNEAQGKSTSKD